MLPVDQPGEEKREIVRDQNAVRTAQKERRTPVPPAGLKSPEVAECPAHPAVASALDGHGGGQLRSHQRNRNAPEKRDEEVIEQRQPRTAGRDLVFEAEGSAGRVGVHHKDEGQQGGLAGGRGCGARFAGIGGNVRRPRLNAHDGFVPGEGSALCPALGSRGCRSYRTATGWIGWWPAGGVTVTPRIPATGAAARDRG